MRYMIEMAPELHVLAFRVNASVEQGWVPVGAPFIAAHRTADVEWWHQALYLPVINHDQTK